MIAGPAVALRAAQRSDEEFLRRLYASVREPEFTALGLDAAALASLLSMQFDAQDHAYRGSYPAADFDLVIVAGEPAGRLYVDRGAEAIHLIDIALMPEHRGRGVGTELLRELLAEGRAAGSPVTLNVVRGNPAERLYARLGFTVVREDEVYADLVCTPGSLS